MKNLKRINEAVGSIVERRAAADRLLKDVVKGSTSSVEGIKLSKEMAQAFLDWQRMSTYGKKFGKLPFYMLFTAAFNWGLDRYIGKDKKIKAEYKELKAKAKEMSKEQKMKAESLDEKRSTPYGEIMLDIDAASKQVKLPMSWMKDYVKSIERMAKRNAKRFFKDYGSFSVEDWAEDMEYNFANESKVNEASLGHAEVKKVIKGMSRKNKIALERAIKDGTIKTSEDLSNWAKSINEASKDRMIKQIERALKDGLSIFKLPMATQTYYRKNKSDFETINEAKFSFSEDQVKDVAELIAKAIAKLDKTKAAVHDMEYDAGRGAGFEVSMGGEKYEGGSYVVKPNGDVVNAAIGNAFPNAVYAKIGDKDINKIIKNIKKFESVEVNEAAPKMKKSKEEMDIEKSMMIVSGLKKGGAGNRYGKEFDRAKNKALAAINDMLTYAKIGV